tara:strand:+ start:367 stop:564 length:198 start_codon:yes stop_codon:yes gene_type:complete
MEKITIEINNCSECPCCIQMMKQIDFQQGMRESGLRTTLTCSWRCVVTEKIVNPEMFVRNKYDKR